MEPRQIGTSGFSVYELGQGVELQFQSHEGETFVFPLGKGTVEALIASLQKPSKPLPR